MNSPNLRLEGLVTVHTHDRPRICVISAFRAVVNKDTSLQRRDFPYYAGIAIILAAFENNLSIICASLPVMQPVLTNLTQKIRSTFSRYGTNSTSDQRLGWSSKGHRNPKFGGSGSEEAKFNRLRDHLYPLASTQLPYEGTTTQTTVEGTGSGDVVVEMDDLQQDATQPHSAIAVTRAWKVSSNPSM